MEKGRKPFREKGKKPNHAKVQKLLFIKSDEKKQTE